MNYTTYTRSDKTGRWIKNPSGVCGLCYTISFDSLERLLTTGKLPHTSWKLEEDQFLENVQVGPNGVTVYIGSK